MKLFWKFTLALLSVISLIVTIFFWYIILFVQDGFFLLFVYGIPIVLITIFSILFSSWVYFEFFST